MTADETGQTGPTRRTYMKYGGAVLGGGLLAGCTGGAESDPTETGSESTSTGTEPTPGTETNDESTETTETRTPASESYTVTMSPVGAVEFDGVPQTVFTRLTHHAGMALALGHGDSLNALHGGGYYDVVWNKFLARLDGVSVDWTDLYSATEFGKEKLYDLDSELHLVDPASVLALDNWNESDIDEVATNVGPWFGNKFSADRTEPPAAYAQDYQYYSLWDIFGKVAQVFREQARYEALASVHSEMLSTIEENLPPATERPTVAMVLFSSTFEDMWGYPLNSPGFYSAHTKPLDATGAFAASNVDIGDTATIDAEALAEANPDVILALGGMADGRSMDKIRTHLEADPVMGTLPAVENGRVHPQGARWQGPLLNLFQLEMTAKQLYPEQFGAWPTYVNGDYPEIPEDEQLFDRDHVADIVKGNAQS